MTNTSKPKVGDLVVFNVPSDETFRKMSFALRAEPFMVMKDFEELNNPKLDIQDGEYWDIPQDPGAWVVMKQRDLFTPKGYLVRVVKISNLVSSSSGWISEKSIRFPTESDDLSIVPPIPEE